MNFSQLVNWRGYKYLARMDCLLVFNVDGTKVAEWYCNAPHDVEWGRWFFECLVQTFPDAVTLLDFKTEVVAPWKKYVDARLRECAE